MGWRSSGAVGGAWRDFTIADYAGFGHGGKGVRTGWGLRWMRVSGGTWFGLGLGSGPAIKNRRNGANGGFLPSIQERH